MTGEQVRELTVPSGAVGPVAWSPDGSQLATGGGGGVWVWDAVTGEQLRELTSDRGTEAVAWSPDGSQLATAGGGVWVWDAVTGEQLRELTGKGTWVRAVAWSPG